MSDFSDDAAAEWAEAKAEGKFDHPREIRSRDSIEEILKLLYTLAGSNESLVLHGSRTREEWFAHRDGDLLVAKQAILGWVDKVVIGEDIYWNREQRMKFSTSDIDSFAHLFAVNSTKKDQRNILKQHGYKGEE